jgi:signal transduction histidine kinase
MNLKNLKTNKLIPDNNGAVKNDNLKSSNLSNGFAINGKTLGDDDRIRLLELEKRNEYLEKLIEVRSLKLAESEALNRKYISIIAHDLKDPFISILVVLKLLKKRLNDYDINKIQEFINIASDSKIKTFPLLEELLAWAISQNTEESFKPVRINLFELLKEEIDSIYESALQKQISLNYSISPDMNVTGDHQMVKTILKNLITNAIEFTHTGGKINIKVSEGKSFIQIAVIDNGRGITPEDQQNLFKIESIDAVNALNSEKGCGLSLILCKEFIEIHGGNIWIESEFGKGSKFIFTLPNYN